MVVKSLSFSQATSLITEAAPPQSTLIESKLSGVMDCMQIPPNTTRIFHAQATQCSTKASALAQGVLGINLILRLRTLVQIAVKNKLDSIVTRMTSSHQYQLGAPSSATHVANYFAVHGALLNT